MEEKNIMTQLKQVIKYVINFYLNIFSKLHVH